MPDPGRKPPEESRPLHGLRFGLAGPGRVGRSLARWAMDGGAELDLLVRRTSLPSPSLLSSFHSSTNVHEMSFARVSAEMTAETSQPLDFLLLTVSDEALAPIASCWASRLADPSRRSETVPFRVVLHSAGCFDAEVLSPLRDVGVAVGTLHPLRAFADELPEPGPNPFFALGGDAEAAAVARNLVDAWGGTACELSGERRVIYHLAASLAAGGVMTVLAAVAELMRAADLPDEILDGYLGLLRGAVEAGERAAGAGGPGRLASAITGPAARGDEATLERHRAALRSAAPELSPLVETLWSETRRFTEDSRRSIEDSAAETPPVRREETPKTVR